MEEKDIQSENEEVNTDNVDSSDEQEQNLSEEQQESQTEQPEETEEETVEQKMSAIEQKLSDSEEKNIRLVAEFENYKRRRTQEVQSMLKYANQPLALSIISGMDNLERALEHAREEEVSEGNSELLRGVQMVHDQLIEALEKNNITRVEAKGEMFDPTKHEAMGVIETNDVESEHVANVFQAGYMLADRVIRPAMVQVAKKKS